MNAEVNPLLQSLKIEKIRPQAPQDSKPVEKAKPGEFEALLKKVNRDVEALKGETKEAANRVDEQIDQPEELQAAVKEAGQKYKSAVKLSKNLIEVYKATIDAVNK